MKSDKAYIIMAILKEGVFFLIWMIVRGSEATPIDQRMILDKPAIQPYTGSLKTSQSKAKKPLRLTAKKANEPMLINDALAM